MRFREVAPMYGRSRRLSQKQIAEIPATAINRSLLNGRTCLKLG